MLRFETPECDRTSNVVVAVCDREDSTENLVHTGELVEVHLALLSDLQNLHLDHVISV